MTASYQLFLCNAMLKSVPIPTFSAACCAVGCVLSPLCGWCFGWAFLRCVLLFGYWLGLCFSVGCGLFGGLTGGRVRAAHCCLGFAGGGARATWAQCWACFGMFD